MAGPRRIAIIGGGPAGLFLARMIGMTRPGNTVEVYERNGPGDVFGFGVGLSDRTMRGISACDPQTHQRITESSVDVSGIELRLHGARLRYDGFGLATIARDTLLTILREQAENAGAKLHFRQEVVAGDLDADVVAVAEGASSATRSAGQDAFGTTVQTGSARYIWLGTPAGFGDVATMSFVQTAYGPMAAHSYPHSRGMSTVVVETDKATWRNAGIGLPAPGSASPDEISPQSLGLLGEIFAEHLDGRPLVSNKSRWGTFKVVRNERWWHGRTVLLGDAAHTAHFTVGSGTKMALEDGIALATALGQHDEHAAAFAAYERRRRRAVARVQCWAEPSMHWWETYGRRLQMPPAQFGMHFITRTVAISYLGLRRRCPDRIDEAEAEFLRQADADTGPPPRNAIGAPLRLGRVRLPNRLVTVVPQTPQAAGESRPPAPGMPLVQSGLVLARADAPARGPAGALSGILVPPDWEPPAAEAAGALRFVELRCPDGQESDPAADDLIRLAGWLRERGAAGVLLRADFAADSWWDTSLRHASRIRTETGVAVAVCVPADWALDLTQDAHADPWPARIHVALISGRTDLVAAWPLAPAEVARSR